MKESLNKQLIIHIGYNKTATTTVQQSIFNKHPKTLWLRELSPKEMDDMFVGIMFQREIPFSQNIEKYRTHFLTSINEFRSKRNNLEKDYNIVFSCEGLVGVSTSMHYFPDNFRWSPDPVSAARKLKMLFDTEFIKSPKILITIRNQLTFAPSFYAESYPNVGRYRSFRGFNKFIDNYYLKDRFDFFSSTLDYYEIARTYSGLFGKENVYVLPMEYLKNNNDKYNQVLSDLLSIDKDEITSYIKKYGSKNKRKLSNDYYRVRQRSVSDILYPDNSNYPTHYPYLDSLFHKILRHIKNPLIRKKKLVYTEEQKLLMTKKYAENNKRLSNEFNLNLDQFGYF